MTNYDHPLMDRQVDLEEAMAVAGRDAFWKEINEAKAKGQESNTVYGRQLLRYSVVVMAEEVRAWIAKAEGQAGARHKSIKFLKQLEPEVSAFIALKQMLDSASAPEMQRSNLAINIGGACEDEVRFNKLKEQAPLQHKQAVKTLEGRAAKDRYRKRSRFLGSETHASLTWDDWKKADKLNLGLVLVEIACRSTGLFETRKATVGKKDTPIFVVPTDKALEWIASSTQRMELLSAQYWPTVVPPKRWTTPWNGGYWSANVKRLPLVKTRNKVYLEELRETDMDNVYDAVNAVQETPWVVDKRILDTLKWAMETNMEIGKLPPAEDLELPPTPHDIAENEDARIGWKKEAAQVYWENIRIRSKRLQLWRVIRMGEKFKDEEAIYFPHQLDFRGRLYAVPMFLHPQGPEHTKALLRFAKGKPIETEEQACWLAIHGANVYGEDKIGLQDRVQWVDKHHDQIMAVAADPQGTVEFWGAADSPFMFLAFCLEWAAFMDQGYGYVSSLPVSLDGSCNGLQHYSAALRDPVGGREVNLIPSEVPRDIYQTVADRTADKVRLDCSVDGASEPEPGSDPWIAERVLPHLTRKVTKKAVMCLPYGLTRFSARDYIEEGLREVLQAQVGRGVYPFRHQKVAENGYVLDAKGFWEAARYLTPLIWQSIQETVQGASSAMSWLQECAKLASSEGLPVNWTTPDGFYVEQRYFKTERHRVKTNIDGEIIFAWTRDETQELDKRTMTQAIAPNWVHSMDAAALRLYVNRAQFKGIQHFAMVHDSYGTVAADVPAMRDALREAFVEMYEDHDVLAEFRQEIADMLSPENLEQLPEVPQKGDLDLTQVLESDFFFA